MRTDLQRLKRDTGVGTSAASHGSAPAAEDNGGPPGPFACCSILTPPLVHLAVRLRKRPPVRFPQVVRRRAAASRCEPMVEALERSSAASRCCDCGDCRVGASLLLLRQTSKHLTDKDTIVLADFRNETGDAVFDDTLRRRSRSHSASRRFWIFCRTARLPATLKLMYAAGGHEADAGGDARPCASGPGAQAYVAGTISSLGTDYVVGLRAANCQTDDTLAAAAGDGSLEREGVECGRRGGIRTARAAG